MITYKQLTLAEIFEDCQNKFDNDKYQFLSLLDEATPVYNFINDRLADKPAVLKPLS